jgi:hypothetical protein
MKRPEFVTDEDIERWSDNIDNDPNISLGLSQNPIIREVLYAGLWLHDELTKLNCPDDISARIRYTAGKISFGRDFWEIHQNMLEQYKNNQLVFEEELN